MGQSESHGVKGKLHLQRNWKETSSTHLETFNDIWLEPGTGDNVVLVHAHGQTNSIKKSDTDYREDKYVISAKELNSLIREHDKKI